MRCHVLFLFRILVDMPRQILQILRISCASFSPLFDIVTIPLEAPRTDGAAWPPGRSAAGGLHRSYGGLTVDSRRNPRGCRPDSPACVHRSYGGFTVGSRPSHVLVAPGPPPSGHRVYGGFTVDFRPNWAPAAPSRRSVRYDTFWFSLPSTFSASRARLFRKHRRQQCGQPRALVSTRTGHPRRQ